MSKPIFFAIIAGLAVVVIGGTYAYTQRPERVVGNALQKLADTEEQHFVAEIALGSSPATEQLLGEPAQVVITLDGSFDRNEDERDSLATNVDIGAASDSVSFQIAGEMRFIGDSAYIYVQKVPPAVPQLAAIKNQWVSLPRGGQVAGLSAEASAEEGPLLANVKKIGSEKINDVSAVKYEAVATDVAVVRLMDHIARLLGTSLTADQIDSLRANLQGASELPVTLWVTPASHRLVKLETRLNPGQSQVRYTITFPEKDEPVSHTPPERSAPLQEVVANAPAN